MKPNNQPISWILAGAGPALLALVAFTLGAYLFGAPDEKSGAPQAVSHVGHEDPEQAKTTWTCSMHPSVQMPQKGKCPICFMDLIPLTKKAGGGAQVALQPEVINLLGIETRPVVRKALAHEVSMVGSLVIDETRTSMISAWVPGRIDRLFVDSTGISVRQGDHLADLYSPPLYQAQVELGQARAALSRAKDGHLGKVDESLLAAATSGVHAVEERMRLWGLTKPQIAELSSLESPTDQITIYAPSNGVVTSKLVHEGRYVETGTPIYSIADLSSLWLELQAFETDLPWLFLGQEVRFETDSLPGETFEGQITFIEPWIDSSRRTAKLRVEVSNTHGRLKPEMFVRAKVIAQVGSGGTALAPDLAGTFSCPMHPEVRSDHAGTCPICEMPLEPLSLLAESFGLSANSQEAGLPLVIPTTAPLITGRRAVVYVQADGKDGERIFEGREIELGPRASGMYVVLSGLQEGELVVSRGAFKLDSELELNAQPSWMNSAVWDEDPPLLKTPQAVRFEVLPTAFESSWRAFWESYLPIQANLASDDLTSLDASLLIATDLFDAIAGTADLLPDAAEAFRKDSLAIRGSLQEMRAPGLDIAEKRKRFEIFTSAVFRALEHFGSAVEGPVFVLHCPMAFDGRGADWLQVDELVNNPYYGAAMLRCGSVLRTLIPETSEVSTRSTFEIDDKLQAVEELPTGALRVEELPASRPSEEPALESVTEESPVAQAPIHLTPFRESWSGAWQKYLEIQNALASDDSVALDLALAGASEWLSTPWNQADLDASAAKMWRQDKVDLGGAINRMIAAGPTLADQRIHFEALSTAAAISVGHFGDPADGPIYRVHCPMAFGGRGADWLQAEKRVSNPYFGSQMLRCGSVTETLILGPGEDK